MVTDATNSNIAALLDATAANQPDGIALKLDDFELSFGVLRGMALKFAGHLKAKGIEPGDRVAIMLPNVPHFAIAYYGALQLGAVVVPMNPLLSPREIAYYLANSGAKCIYVWNAFAEGAQAGADEAGVDCVVVDPAEFPKLVAAAEPIAGTVNRGPEDTAVILYTSGTTGLPKGAELTHDNLGQNIARCGALYDPTPGDVLFGALPFFHAFGQVGALNVGVAYGATVTLLPRFEADAALKLIERDKVTVFLGVPTMHTALAGSPDTTTDISSLRIAISGGASLPVEVLNAFEKKFNCPVLEGYGLSETSPIASFNQLAVGTKPGSIGTPIEGVEMRIVGEDGQVVPTGERGEIEIRGHNIMKGYWQNPEATAAAISEDGWFKSGDIGTTDEDGFFYVVDRKKDLIIRGGYNVYPREIEEVLYEHPAVLEAAVIGIPHETLGEEVGAAVVLKPGTSATPDELQAFVKPNVAAYKYPRLVWLLDELPKGPTGKILKREIKAPAA